MPELPEVEDWRQLAEAAARGRRVASVYAARDEIVLDRVTPARLRRALSGARIEAAHRRGKYLWLELDRRPWPLFHFGMSGSLRRYRNAKERPSYTKLELTLDSGERVAFRNVRRLGRLRLLQDPESEPPVSRLGPDPLLDLQTNRELLELFARRKAPVKALLLILKSWGCVTQ